VSACTHTDAHTHFHRSFPYPKNRHLNNAYQKVCYSEESVIQRFVIKIKDSLCIQRNTFQILLLLKGPPYLPYKNLNWMIWNLTGYDQNWRNSNKVNVPSSVRPFLSPSFCSLLFPLLFLLNSPFLLCHSIFPLSTSVSVNVYLKFSTSF
jgi:hypothetical protein